MNTAPMVLVQPGLPGSHQAVRDELPGFSPSVVAGLRRRAWQHHVASLGSGNTTPSVPADEGPADTDLFLVQINSTQRVPVPSGAPPFRCMPLCVAEGRRRARAARHRPGLANRGSASPLWHGASTMPPSDVPSSSWTAGSLHGLAARRRARVRSPNSAEPVKGVVVVVAKWFPHCPF